MKPRDSYNIIGYVNKKKKNNYRGHRPLKTRKHYECGKRTLGDFTDARRYCLKTKIYFKKNRKIIYTRS